MEIIAILFMIIPTAICLLLVTYFFNRSRWTLDQAVSLGGYDKKQLQKLLQERLLEYRPKYIFLGPKTINPDDIPAAIDALVEIQHIHAERDAEILQSYQRIHEAHRIYEEQSRILQEQLEQFKRMHAELLRDFRNRHSPIPPNIVRALQILDLPEDATFDNVRRQYRNLAKQHHPDTGGNPEKFIEINKAYNEISFWIQTKY